MSAKISEAMIQKGVLDFLELFSRTKPVYYFRAGAGAVKTEQGRFFKTGRAGLPDIIVLYMGRMIGLEVKTATGKQSQGQKQAQEDIVNAGGEYHVIRSIADVKKVLPL